MINLYITYLQIIIITQLIVFISDKCNSIQFGFKVSYFETY